MLTIKVALLNYCAANNENVPEQSLNAWVSRFEELGVPAEKICEAIRRAEMSKKYGATKFSDFTDMLLEEGMIFTYAEMHKLISERLGVIIDNIKLEQKQKEEREAELKKEFDMSKEELDKFTNDVKHRRKVIDEEVNKVLNDILFRFERLHVSEWSKIVRNERRTIDT